MPLQEVAPDAECYRGRLRWSGATTTALVGCLLRKDAYAVMPVGSGWAQPAKPMQLSRWGGKRSVKWAAGSQLVGHRARLVCQSDDTYCVFT